MTDQLRGGLFELTAIFVLAGLAIVAIALLTGPYRWAVALRRGVASIGRSVWCAGGRLTRARRQRRADDRAVRVGALLRGCQHEVRRVGVQRGPLAMAVVLLTAGVGLLLSFPVEI